MKYKLSATVVEELDPDSVALFRDPTYGEGEIVEHLTMCDDLIVTIEEVEVDEAL